MRAPYTSLRWGVALGAIVLAVAAMGRAQTSTQALLVALESDKMVAIIDPKTGNILGRAPTDENPNGVAVSPDGKFAFTANLRPGTLSVIDLANRKEVRRVKVGPGSQPNDALVAGGKLYFTARGYKAIGRYDPTNDEIAWFGGGQDETHILAMSKNGDTLFASNRESNTVSIIEGVLAGPAKWTITHVPIGGSPDGVDLAGDRELWAGLRFGAGLAVIDVATKKVTRIDLPFEKTSGEGSQAARLRLTPDGKRAFLLNRPTQELVVLDTATRKEIKRIKLAGQSLLIAPDGSRAYVTVSDENYIAVIDVKTLELTSPLKIAGSPNAMAWVPGN